MTDSDKLHTAAPAAGAIGTENAKNGSPELDGPIAQVGAEPESPKFKDAAQPALNKWQSFWVGVLHIDKTKMEPWIAARNAIGVAAPLLVGLALHMPQGGLAVASGALNVSYSDSHDPYSLRAKRMLASAALCAVAVMAGGLAGHHNTAAILLATIWAFGSGMAVALGTTGESLGVVSLVVLIIFSAQALRPERALQAAGLAFAGGAIQTLLSLALWPVRSFDPERRALANLYDTLAKAAADPDGLMKAAPPSAASTLAQQALATRAADHGIESERMLSLLSQAERMRLRLFTLGRLLRRMRREKFGFAPAEMVESFLESAAHVMAAIGDSLARGSALRINESWMLEMRTITGVLREKCQASDRSFLSAVVRDARFQMDALAGQVRAALQLAADITPWGSQAIRELDKRLPWRMRITGDLARLFANFSLQSAVYRHAIRLAAAVAISEIISRRLETPRAYWLPMTTVLVLKPEFTVTFTRGLLRIVGTILGLLLATAMFHFLPPGAGWEVLLVALFVFLLRWVGPANYGVFGVAVSALVVLLVTFTGVAPKDVIVARGFNTVIGGLLALAIYAVWPSWERTQVGEMIARLLDSYLEYFSVVLEETSRADAPATQRLDKARLAARLARTNAVASVERMRGEPGSRPKEVALLTEMLANSHRFVHAIMSIEASILPSHRSPVRREFRTFADDISATLTTLTTTFRHPRQPMPRMPDLREAHRRLVEAPSAAAEQYALVNVEADRMANSLNTLSEQVAAWRQITTSR